MADDFSFEIVKNIGIVSEGKGGWNLELNLVSWSGRPAKYDFKKLVSRPPENGKRFNFLKRRTNCSQKLIE